MRKGTNGFYVIQGTLHHDALSYVERAADTELLHALERGEFCYVLTSRQMGKSSLMVRTVVRLRQQGIRVAALDLTALGQNLSPEQWYEGLLSAMGLHLDLEDELDDFWREHERLGPLQRWMRALREVVLPQLSARCSVLGARQGALETDRTVPTAEHRAPSTERLVVFIDEIDTVRSLPFSTDEFFAAIRECYNRRTGDAAFERLTFCLLGVATPSDLIRDVRMTPFNIGRRIELDDFREEEAASLRVGLELGSAETPGRPKEIAHRLLRRIFYWTSGHPYLTQRLCQAVAEDASVTDAAGVDRRCEELFLSPRARERDDNVVFVRDRLLRSEADLASLLDLYGQVRSGKRVAVDDTNPLVELLRLSGVARVADGQSVTPSPLHPFTPSSQLRVRNRIYARVFDEAWVRQHMPDAEVRRQRAAFRRGLVRAASIAGVVVAVMAGLTTWAVRQQHRAETSQEEHRRHLVRVYVGRGAERLDQGDMLGALPWLMEAFHLDRGHPEAERIHRTRLGFLLRHCPRLVQMWFRDETLGPVEFSPDGRRILIAAGKRVELLDATSGQRIGRPMEHPAVVSAARFSRSGNRLVTASEDGSVRVWSAMNGQPVTRTFLHSGHHPAVDIAPAGDRVLAGGEDGKARVWDASTGRLVGPPAQHGAAIEKVWFLPGERQIFVAGKDMVAGKDSARAWSVGTGQPAGKEISYSPDANPGVAPLALSPDGRTLVTSGYGRALRWDVASGRPISPELPHIHNVLFAAFSLDGSRLATLGGTPDLHVWDTKTGAPVCPPLDEHGGIAQFSPDGRWLLTGGLDGTLRLRDAASGVPLVLSLPHSAAVWAARFAPDGRRILTASADNTVRLWELASIEPMGLPLAGKAAAWRAAFTPDSRRVATLSGPDAARMWDATTGAPLPAVIEQPGLKWDANYLCVSPDGRRIFTAGSGTGRLWEAETGKPLTAPLPLGGAIRQAVFSPDGRRILTLSGRWESPWSASSLLLHLGGRWPDAAQPRLQIRVWETATGSPAGPTPRPKGDVQAAAFLGGGHGIGTLSVDTSRRVWLTEWNVETGREARPPMKLPTRLSEAATYSFCHAAFSADGRQLATTFANTAQVWDVATGRSLTAPLPQAGTANGEFFSPDGRRLAVPFDLNYVQLWDIPTRQPIGSPLKHGAWLSSVAFSSDGRYLSTASADRTTRVWDAATGEPVTPPLSHRGMATVAAISLDSRRLITSSERSRETARLWSLAPAEQPVGDLDQFAQLLTGKQIGPNTASLPLAPQTLRTAWNNLRGRYPDAFSCPPKRARAWHRQEAQECEWQQQWAAAVFHYDQILAAWPKDRDARQARARAALTATADSPGYHEQLSRRIPPRGPLTAPAMIDLGRFYNLALHDSLEDFLGLLGISLSELPGGLQNLNGVAFDVRGVVQLTGGGQHSRGARHLPRQVSDIPVNQGFRRLHLLHGSYGGPFPAVGTSIALLVLHYADGTERQMPIRYGQDLHELGIRPPPQSPANVAWTGTAEDGSQIRLYRSTWDNPRPGQTLATIDLVSAMSTSPLIVAMTLE
jgi:WD40 repeat protein